MAINGFSVCNPSVCGVYRVPGTRRSLMVRREIAPLLIGFAAEFHRLVEPIDTGQLDDWGYDCRRVIGKANTSFHAGGLAIDLNATKHPLGRTGTFTPKQNSIIRALCRKYGLRWGGDFRRRKDPMHVEVILPRAAALALVKRLQIKPTAKPTKVPIKITRVPAGHHQGLRGPFPLPPHFAFGMAGHDYSGNENRHAHDGVVQIQRALNGIYGNKLAVDGSFGAKTAAQVKTFQKAMSLTVDGRVGPATWAALDRRTP